MSNRIWILIASLIPPLSLIITLFLFISPKSEAANGSTLNADSNIFFVNQICGYQSHVLADNPIAFWRLDETSSLTAANLGSIGSSANGTYTNGVALGVTGLVIKDLNLAAQFDGFDDYVSIPSHGEINLGSTYAERTIELWFKPSVLSGTQVLYEEGGQKNGFNIFLDDDELHIGTYASMVGTWVTQTVEAGKAYHVVLTFDGNAQIVTGYLNGTSFGSSVTHFTAVPLHPGRIAIGAVHDGSRYPWGGANILNGDHFGGIIDDVILYNSVLSSTRIQLHAAGCALLSSTSIEDDSPDPSTEGETFRVTFSVKATLPGSVTPTGTVTVTISDEPEYCVGILTAGEGECQITPNSAGIHKLTATYGGDAMYMGSSDSNQHLVSSTKGTQYLPLVQKP